MTFETLQQSKERSEYHQHLGQLASREMLHKAQEGFLPGPAPIGYRNRSGTVEVDPSVAPAIINAFKLLAMPNTSFRSVLAELQRQRIKSKRGGPISITTLHRIAHNPFYAGLIWYKGQLYTGNHEPLISHALFQKVQARIEQKQNGTPQS